MRKKKILIISFSDQSKDPRVIRQIQALESDYHIETIGHKPYNGQIKHHSISRDVRNFILRQIQKVLFFIHLHRGSSWMLAWYFKNQLKNLPHDFDLVICNDLRPLPFAHHLAEICNAKLWSDLHEYYPSQITNTRMSRWMNKSYVNWLCKRYIAKAVYKTVVCNCVGDKYHEVFGIEMDAVITNATAYNELNEPCKNEGIIKLVHHGVATPLRELHHMLDMMQFLPSNFELYFYLVANYEDHKSYLNELKNKATRNKLAVTFMKPVPTQQLADELNQYDIGLFILPPVTHNYYCALPNKLYEFIQARLCIAVSPNPEMKSLVASYNLGVVAKDFSAESMANEVKLLTREDIRKHKMNAHNSAEELSFTANANLMRGMAESLVGKQDVTSN